MAKDKNTEDPDLKKDSAAPEAGAKTGRDASDPPENEPMPRSEEPESNPGDKTDSLASELTSVKAALAAQEARYLRLAAEYDNFRKRSQKEKDGIYNDARADALAAFLPVYDNLERALKQTTCDEAYAKGVEMTMKGLTDIMTRLGIETIPALGQPFDPTLHNAVMHVDDEDFEKNIVADVFQQGFTLNGKVIRCAMVKVAN